MKRNLKKPLVIALTVGIPVVIIAAATSAYFSTPLVSRISTQGVYTVRVNQNYNEAGYKYDLSQLYGSTTGSNYISTLVNNEVLHMKTSGKFVYEEEKKDESGQVVSPGRIVQPSYESYKFANGKSIVLTFISTSLTEDEYLSGNLTNDKYFQLVFDNDDDEIIPPTKDNIVVSKDSDVVRSINNSKVFWKILSKGFLEEKIDLDASLSNVVASINKQQKNYVLASMGVTFKKYNRDQGKFEDPAYWVDSNGNKTKYEIVPEDMFYSSERTRLCDVNYRRSHGGSKEIDSYIIQKTSPGNAFSEKRRYPNEYLWDFFGVSIKRMYDEKTAIQEVQLNEADPNSKTKAFTLSFEIFKNDKTVNMNFASSAGDVIKKYFVNAIHFSLAPSEYIKDKLVKNQDFTETPAGKITGDAHKYAIYTYAQTREETLFASNYIPVSTSAGREIFEYNKHFSDKEWVKSVTEPNSNGEKTINRIIYEYTGSVDTSTFINQSYASFLNGTLSNVDYSLLSDSQKQKLYGDGHDAQQLLENAKLNGLVTSKEINTTVLTSIVVWQSSPEQAGEKLFNETYSKLMFGCDKKTIDSGKAVTTNSFFADLGFKFRTMIQAAINWNYFIELAYAGTRDAWLSGAAPNAKFVDIEGSMTPADFLKGGINDLIWFDVTKDPNNMNEYKKVVKYDDMVKLSYMTPDQIKDMFGPEAAKPENLHATKLRSPQYNQIKAAMKQLLDEFYKKENLSPDTKIEWEIAYPFADQNQIRCGAMSDIVQLVINSLDSRISARFMKPTTSKELEGFLVQRKGAFNFKKWSYDYEGIGSWLAAFASDGGGANISSAISIFSKEQNDPDEFFTSKTIDNVLVERPSKKEVLELQNAFPKFTEMSKYVRNMFNQMLGAQADPLLRVENWDLINNKNINSIDSYFTLKPGSKVKAGNADLDRNPNQIKPTSALPAIFKAFETTATWQDGKTPEEAGRGWIEFIQEVNIVKGVSIDTESSTKRLEGISYSLYLREYTVPISKHGIIPFSDITYKVGK